jgi:hypothetical protein
LTKMDFCASVCVHLNRLGELQLSIGRMKKSSAFLKICANSLVSVLRTGGRLSYSKLSIGYRIVSYILAQNQQAGVCKISSPCARRRDRNFYVHRSRTQRRTTFLQAYYTPFNIGLHKPCECRYICQSLAQPGNCKNSTSLTLTGSRSKHSPGMPFAVQYRVS